jgi:hypothetical protein
MAYNLNEFSTSCRFCLEAKFKTSLITSFHVHLYYKLTGEILIDHGSFPITICHFCNREFHRFNDFREKLIEKQRRLHESLEQNKNSIEVVSMAENVPTYNDDEETESNVSDSTLRQNEVDEETLKVLKKENPRNAIRMKNIICNKDRHRARNIKIMKPKSSKDKILVANCKVVQLDKKLKNVYDEEFRNKKNN